MPYPNYRVSVEIYLKQNDKTLICKRVPKSDVDPGKWSVSAGKVKYDEIPTDAVIRETKEELNLSVRIIEELDCRAVTLKVKGKDAYRLLFSYLVEQVDESENIILNDEHTECRWVTKEEIDNAEYCTLYDKQKEIIKQILS
jgi:ADP-ribose pyrophosphatase YjhB (NUDIX family)